MTSSSMQKGTDSDRVKAGSNQVTRKKKNGLLSTPISIVVRNGALGLLHVSTFNRLAVKAM